MSQKKLDSHGRFRSVSASFRVSPEENDLLNRLVALSGLTKREYIARRLLNRDIIVQGNPKVYKALKNQLAEVLEELRRIESGGTVNDELLALIAQIAEIMKGMKVESEWTSTKK
ncbi:MAG: hypothetical protein IJM46_07475 [Oscillospiraceae bacterium]|nr:hypothetical protein [Oscillospiraceae bacterium]